MVTGDEYPPTWAVLPDSLITAVLALNRNTNCSSGGRTVSEPYLHLDGSFGNYAGITYT